VTPDEFRRLALALPDAVEGEHMNHPDFRANGRIFATLLPGGERGMVRVSPLRQRELLRDHARAFAAGSGAWGRQGCTLVRLADVNAAVLRGALTDAWQAAMAQPPAKSRPKTKAPKQKMPMKTNGRPAAKRARGRGAKP
jgi:hypothetical protein